MLIKKKFKIHRAIPTRNYQNVNSAEVKNAALEESVLSLYFGTGKREKHNSAEQSFLVL